ncbi:hypothetical protein Tco_0320032 [Tanacetum coccineum]
MHGVVARVMAKPRRLRSWSKQKIGSNDIDIDFFKDEAVGWESIAETRNLKEFELEASKEVRKNWIEKDRCKSDMLKQQSRVKWIHDVSRGIFKGVKIGHDDIPVSHLQYSDDTNDEIKRLANRMGVSHGFLPFTYLGLLVGVNMKKIVCWNGKVEKESGSGGKKGVSGRCSSGKWSDIIKVGNDIEKTHVPFIGSYRKKVGNGYDVRVAKTSQEVLQSLGSVSNHCSVVYARLRSCYHSLGE